MLTRIIASTFALALVAATGCNKADNSAANADAKSAAKSAEGESCPHAKGDKMHGDKMHGDKMHGDKIDPAEHAAKLAEKLGLNAEQTTAAQALFVEVEPQLATLRGRTLAIHKEMQALHSKDGKTPDAKLIETKKAEFVQVKADKSKLHEEVSAKLDAILTPEQRVAHAELMKSHYGKDGKHGCSGDCAHGDKGGKHDCGGDCAHAGKAGKHECSGDCAHGDKGAAHGNAAKHECGAH